jgi:pimeloyl-ACP methyl ester carboxylesterase
MKKAFSGIAAVFLLGYFFVLGWYYLNQEQLIFRPSVLEPSYEFSYAHPFEEIFVTTQDGARLHGLLFKSDSTRGLAFYLHGNAGSLARWGREADVFVENGFDIFIMDYRGYGKSTGTITSEEQFLSDVDTMYRSISTRYPGLPKAIAGYSLGTGPAAWLAGKYDPELLVLKAPYYSIPDLAGELYPFLPGWLAKYTFATYKHLQEVDSKVVVFHGDEDGLIGLNASRRLQQFFTREDTLIVLPGQGHNGLRNHPTYREHMQRALREL